MAENEWVTGTGWGAPCRFDKTAWVVMYLLKRRWTYILDWAVKKLRTVHCIFPLYYLALTKQSWISGFQTTHPSFQVPHLSVDHLDSNGLRLWFQWILCKSLKITPRCFCCFFKSFRDLNVRNGAWNEIRHHLRLWSQIIFEQLRSLRFVVFCWEASSNIQGLTKTNMWPLNWRSWISLKQGFHLPIS